MTVVTKTADMITYNGVLETAIHLNCERVSSEFDLVLVEATSIDISTASTLPKLSCFTSAGVLNPCEWNANALTNEWDFEQGRNVQRLTAKVRETPVVVEQEQSCLISLKFLVERTGAFGIADLAGVGNITASFEKWWGINQDTDSSIDSPDWEGGVNAPIVSDAELVSAQIMSFTLSARLRFFSNEVASVASTQENIKRLTVSGAEGAFVLTSNYRDKVS